MENQKLYDSLVCALFHNLEACDKCKKCVGNNCAEIRMNLIRELAKKLNLEIPWQEGVDVINIDSVENGFGHQECSIDEYTSKISEINSFDNYTLPDDYDNTFNKINSRTVKFADLKTK